MADGPSASDILFNTVAKVKRKQVSTACQLCRRRKTKCDGSRPCLECVRRNVECVYVAQENETQQQALKRRHDQFAQLYDSLSSQDEDRALDTFRRIRAGQQVETILKHIQTRDVGDTPEHHSRRVFLVSLAQSTANLAEITKVAAIVLLNPEAASRLPPSAAYQPLRDSIITIDALSALLSADPGRGVTQIAEKSHDGPICWVPSTPWTTLTKNDTAVSHLISIYLTFINPYWRFVEQDVFLHAMRSRTDHTYCSPLLVNAMLAFASHYSEIDEAFDEPEHMLTRGDHFFREAMRLWRAEDNRPTVTNVQALLLMTIRIALRGQDKVGFELLSAAGVMIKSLPVTAGPFKSTPEATTARVRACAIWSTAWTIYTWLLGFQKDTDLISFSTAHAPPPEINSLLPDKVSYWAGYPLTQEPFPLRANALMQSRYELCGYMSEVFSPDDSTLMRPEVFEAAQDLDTRLRTWYRGLPTDLRYQRNMPSPLYEFHLQYFNVNMSLWNKTWERLVLDGEENVSSLLGKATVKARMHCLEYAHLVANTVRDFREVYGLSIVPPYLMHTPAVAIMVLLPSMREVDTLDSRDRARAQDLFGIGSLEKLIQSFEECFRCLMAASLQQMLAHGVMRMIYHTILRMNVRLPETVKKMLDVLAEMDWKPSDVHQLSSRYPSWTVNRAGQEKQQLESLLLQWEQLDVRDGEVDGEDDSADDGDGDGEA